MRFLTENYRGLCFECWFYVGQNSGNACWSESEKNMKEEVRHENLERILNCPSPGTSIGTLFNQIQGLPWWLRWERSRLQCRRLRFDPWVGKISWRRQWPPTPVFLPGESHRQRSLAGYILWGHKESDMIEWLTHTHTHTHTVSSYFCWIVCKGSLACVSYWVWVHFNSVQQDFILLSKLRKQPLSGTCCSHGKRKRIMSWLLKLLQGNVTSAHVSLVKQVTQPGLNSV